MEERNYFTNYRIKKMFMLMSVMIIYNEIKQTSIIQNRRN